MWNAMFFFLVVYMDKLLALLHAGRVMKTLVFVLSEYKRGPI